MDKRPVYPGAIPLDLDLLTPQRNTELALGAILESIFGSTTTISGLAVVPTSPASMKVDVGPGCIIFTTTVDTLTSGFGSLPLDNSDALVKVGHNLTKTTMATLTAPATAGQSQNWLVEAQFIEADGSPVVLPYYNAANPAQPYTGPANAGTTNNTARTNRVQLQWKAGTAAATGSQNTPAPDAGWVGVALVTVANGQSTITSANITPYTDAPYIPTKLPVQRTRLFANLNLYVSPTGNDLNTGLSSASPFATLQRAWDMIVAKYDLDGFKVTVNVANGTYTSGLNAQGSPLGNTRGVGGVLFTGNAASPSSVLVSVTNSNAFAATVGSAVTISGFKVTATGSGLNGCGIFAATGASVQFSNMEFGTCGNNQIWAAGSCNILGVGNYTISGGAAAHLAANSGGILGVSSSVVVTLSGTPAFGGAFVTTVACGVANVAGLTFSGTTTGARYSAILNGVIGVNGAAATYLPGSASGVTSTGGQYG